MNLPDWENWVIDTLRRRSLTEPPERVLERAYAIPARRRGLPQWFAAAAVLIVAVSATIVLTPRRAPSLPAGPVDSVVRSGEVTLIEPVGILERMPSTFAWENIEEAVSYRLRILAVDDTVLFEQTAKHSPVELPEAVAVTLHAAVTYAWQVDAFDATGALVGQSQPTRFEVRR